MKAIKPIYRLTGFLTLYLSGKRDKEEKFVLQKKVLSKYSIDSRIFPYTQTLIVVNCFGFANFRKRFSMIDHLWTHDGPIVPLTVGCKMKPYKLYRPRAVKT